MREDVSKDGSTLSSLCSNAVAQWVERHTRHEQNPGSNPVLLCRTLGTFGHSTMLQFIQLYG